jgi:hypothetical protein
MTDVAGYDLDFTECCEDKIKLLDLRVTPFINGGQSAWANQGVKHLCSSPAVSSSGVIITAQINVTAFQPGGLSRRLRKQWTNT